MYKTIALGAWDFGVAPMSLVKSASSGLSGYDLSVLVKRANSEFAELARNVQLAAGEVPLHLIAMGATEVYGPNRNGDGFGKQALQRYCHTFEKYARWYRNHKNKDQDKSYGVVKLAYYNPQMHRVELLVALNGSEKAAKANGGLLADDELQLLERGESIPVSMAAKVAYDVCVACGNEAPSRAKYCQSREEGGNCSRFGCRTGLTKVADDGFVQYVDNPHPHFFDISKVYRNADPIAFGDKARYMAKAASCEYVPGGAELAELAGVSAPAAMVLPFTQSADEARQVQLAYKLAAVEDQLESTQSPSRQDRALALAFSPQVQPPADLTPLCKAGSATLATGLAALASQQVSLPVRDFLRLIVDERSDKYAALVAEVPGLLPGIYNRLITDDSLVERIRHNPFKPSQGLAPASQRQWAAKQAATHSLQPELVQSRAALMAIRHNTTSTLLQRSEKSAAEASSEAYDLARRYALYKLAFLSAQVDVSQLTCELAIRQNYTS